MGVKAHWRLIALAWLVAALSACDGLQSIKAPQRKPGLWRLVITRSYDPRPAEFLQCFNGKADRRFPIFSMPASERCERASVVRRADGSLVGERRCKGVGSGFRMSGDARASYVVDEWRQRLPGEAHPPGQAVLSRHLEAVYQGACPPEIVPGSERRPDGGFHEIGAEVLH